MTTMTQTHWEYLVVPLPEAKGLKKGRRCVGAGSPQCARGAWLGSDRPLAQVRRSHGVAGGLTQAPARTDKCRRGARVLSERPPCTVCASIEEQTGDQRPGGDPKAVALTPTRPRLTLRLRRTRRLDAESAMSRTAVSARARGVRTLAPGQRCWVWLWVCRCSSLGWCWSARAAVTRTWTTTGSARSVARGSPVGRGPNRPPPVSSPRVSIA